MSQTDGQTDRRTLHRSMSSRRVRSKKDIRYQTDIDQLRLLAIDLDDLAESTTF